MKEFKVKTILFTMYARSHKLADQYGYQFQRWQRVSPNCRNHSLVLFLECNLDVSPNWFIWATWRVLHVEMYTLLEHLRSTTVFGWVGVAQILVFDVVFFFLLFTVIYLFVVFRCQSIASLSLNITVLSFVSRQNILPKQIFAQIHVLNNYHQRKYCILVKKH